MTTLDEVLDSRSHPHKLRLLAVAKAVWPDVGSLPAPEGGRRLSYIEDVLLGMGCPVLSRKEREAILAAAARIPEEP
jgi:hypothetical protein